MAIPKGVFLVILEENVEEEVVCNTWERNSKCGSDCYYGWVRGCSACCPPTKLAPMAPGPDMDPKLWNWLPSDSLETILERLPRASQFQTKAVCKEWSMLMKSLAFFRRSALAAVSLRRSPCLVWDTVAGHHIGSRSWPRLQLLKVNVPCDTPADTDRWLDTHVFPAGVRKHKEGAYYDHLWSEGVLSIINICEDGDPSGLDISVVNPITRTWIGLPYLALASPSQARVIVAPAKDHSKSNFRVMVRSLESCGGPDHMHPPLASGPCGGACRIWCFNVYCSKTGAWCTTKSVEYEHPDIHFIRSIEPDCPRQLQDEYEAQLYINNSHLVVDGLLYVLGYDPTKMLVLSAEYGTVVKHLTDLGDGGIAGPWAKNQHGQKFAHLVEHEGGVYCVAFTPRNCSIWKLLDAMDGSNPRWAHTSSFYWSGTGASETLNDVILFSVVAMDGRIYAAFKGSDHRFIPSGEILLSYDFQGGTWKTISTRFSNILFAPRPELYLPHPLSVELDLEAENAELAVYTRVGYW